VIFPHSFGIAGTVAFERGEVPFSLDEIRVGIDQGMTSGDQMAPRGPEKRAGTRPLDPPTKRFVIFFVAWFRDDFPEWRWPVRP
jgi:hypothetical protein